MDNKKFTQTPYLSPKGERELRSSQVLVLPVDITRILPEDFKLEAGNPVAWNRAGALAADHRGTLPPEAGVT